MSIARPLWRCVLVCHLVQAHHAHYGWFGPSRCCWSPGRRRKNLSQVTARYTVLLSPWRNEIFCLRIHDWQHPCRRSCIFFSCSNIPFLLFLLNPLINRFDWVLLACWSINLIRRRNGCNHMHKFRTCWYGGCSLAYCILAALQGQHGGAVTGAVCGACLFLSFFSCSNEKNAVRVRVHQHGVVSVQTTKRWGTHAWCMHRSTRQWHDGVCLFPFPCVWSECHRVRHHVYTRAIADLQDVAWASSRRHACSTDDGCWPSPQLAPPILPAVIRAGSSELHPSIPSRGHSMIRMKRHSAPVMSLAQHHCMRALRRRMAIGVALLAYSTSLPKKCMLCLINYK